MSEYHQYWKQKDSRQPWEWYAENGKLKGSPLGDRFLPHKTPWLKEPLEEIAKNSNTEVTCMCCVQGGKTVIMQIAATWALMFEPASMLLTCQTNDDAKDFAKERFNESVNSISELSGKLPKDKSKRATCYISFREGFILIQGANRSNLQGKPVRWVFNDEVHLWKKGLLDEARDRTTRFWNRRRCNFSTAGEKGCDLDLAYEEGDMREWSLMCPACKQINLPTWERVKWPKEGVFEVPNSKGEVRLRPIKLENGEWSYDVVKHVAYFECAHCKVQHRHTEEVAYEMNAGGVYVATNPNPSPGFVSFRWNALCLPPSVMSWGDLAVLWIKAEKEFAKGNEEPRRNFITKRLAESYDPNKYIKFEKLPTHKFEGEWKDEAYRFLTVDVQETEFWGVIRAWAKNGESRLLWAGRMFTWDEVEAKQNEFKVAAQCVFIDAAYEQNKVVRECAKRNKLVGQGKRADWLGWKALDGENQESKSFTYNPPNSKPMLLPYSWPPKYLSGNSGIATGKAFAKFHLWSNKTVKDILFNLLKGRGAKWLAYEGAPQDWHDHMNSERRIRVYDKLGQEKVKWERIGKRANHLWDCEAMQVVAACMAQIIGEPIPDGAKEAEEKAVAA